MEKSVSFKFRPTQSKPFEVDTNMAGKLLSMQSALIHEMAAVLRDKHRDNPLWQKYLDLTLEVNTLYGLPPMPIDMVEDELCECPVDRSTQKMQRHGARFSGGRFSKEVITAMQIACALESRGYDSLADAMEASTRASIRAAYYAMLRNMKRNDALIRLSERFGIPWVKIAEIVG